MVNDTEGKDSSTRTVDSLMARDADKPEPRQPDDDDALRIGGDLQTRSSSSQPGSGAQIDEDDGQHTGGSHTPPDDDPERGA